MSLSPWLLAAALLAGAGCATQKSGGGGPVNTVQVGGVALRQGAEAKPVKVRPVREYNEAVQVYEDGAQGGLMDHARLEAKLKDVLTKEPNFASAWFNLGVVYQDQGADQKARQAYSKTLEIDPHYMDALANLGQMQMEAGDRDGAIASFEKAIEIDVVNPTARNNLAVVYRQNAVKVRQGGDVERANKMFLKAVGHVRKVLAGDPQNIQAYNNLALIYYDLRKYELAQLVCLNALKFDKPDAGLHNNLGLILLKLNKVTQALKSFNAALEVDPGHIPAHMNIGLITLSYRDFANAQGHFDSVLKVDDGHVEALVGKAVAARGMGKHGEAVALYGRVRSLAPKDARACWNLGVLHQQYLQKPQQAIEDYRCYLKYARTEDKASRDQARQRIENLQLVMKYQAEEAAQDSGSPKGPPEGDESAQDVEPAAEAEGGGP